MEKIINMEKNNMVDEKEKKRKEIKKETKVETKKETKSK